MYSGELEVQAKRKALATLHNEINRILNSARDLSALTALLMKGDVVDIQLYLDRMSQAGEEEENIRSNITTEISEIGSIIVYREDVLRTAYIVDDIAGYISGVAFRLANINMSALKRGKFDEDVKHLIAMVIDTIFKLNEMVRALSINPTRTIELAHSVQKLERQIDKAYRSVIVRALNEILPTTELFLLKDIVEGIEGTADKCQEASSSLAILALNM